MGGRELCAEPVPAFVSGPAAVVVAVAAAVVSGPGVPKCPCLSELAGY